MQFIQSRIFFGIFLEMNFHPMTQLNFLQNLTFLFVKGNQDYKELKKLFKTSKLYHVGCLKTDIRNFVIKSYSKTKSKKGKKIITILTGETDYKSIIKVLNQCNLKNYIIYIEPHPLMKNKTITYFKNKFIYDFKLGNKIPREKLFKSSDFILFGDTQLGTELTIKNYDVIRIYEKVLFHSMILTTNFHLRVMVENFRNC